MPLPFAHTKSFLTWTKYLLTWTNYFLSQAKKFYLLEKRRENDLLAVGKILSVAKKSFSIHSTRKYVIFSLGQNFCLDKNSLSVIKHFVWDKNNFVKADWQGIRFIHVQQFHLVKMCFIFVGSYLSCLVRY